MISKSISINLIMRSLFVFILSFITASLFAQQIPLNQLVQNRLNQLLITADSSVYTSFRNMNWLELQQLNILHKNEISDSVFGLNANENGSYFLNHFTTDDWIKTAANNNILAVDPILEGTVGFSSEKNNPLYSGAAGLRLQSVINNKFSFDATFLGHSNQFPMYVDSLIVNKNYIIPGSVAAYHRKNNRYNYADVNANFTYTPNKHFLISAGYGKQFIGDGYRSLFLSDNATNYPYLRLQARLWKITYNVLYNRYENKYWYLVNGRSQPKYSALHYLGINVSKKFQISAFDQVVWVAKDTNFQRGFDVSYLNPLLYLRPVEFSIGSPDNAIIGLAFKYNVFRQGYVYGQVALDDFYLSLTRDSSKQFYGNKYALQLGMWNNNIFGVNNLTWRLEWNTVRPYAYGHGVGNNVSLNYTHYYQSLTDPFAANFHEFISMFNYINKRWYGSLENLFTIRGEHPADKPATFNNGEDLWGGEQDIIRFGDKTLQGNKVKYFYNQLSAGYLINPKNRLSIQADAIYRRRFGTGIKQSEVLFSFGIRTNLFNNNYDY
jgi:hypothetical protein